MALAARNNEGKPHMSELAWFNLEWLADHCEQGRKKYPDVDGKPNWTLGGKSDDEYTDAIARHWKAHVRGEFLDSETGTPHLAAVAWNALACLTNNYQYTPGIAGDAVREDAREPGGVDSPLRWTLDLRERTHVEGTVLQQERFRLSDYEAGV